MSDLFQACAALPPFSSRLHDVPPVKGYLIVGGPYHDVSRTESVDESFWLTQHYKMTRLYTIFGSQQAVLLPDAIELQKDLIPLLRASKYATVFGL